MIFKTESDLIQHCIPEITGPGDRVFSEVEVIGGFIDLVVQHPSGGRTAFEFKLRGAGTCIVQAEKRRQWCDRAVAVVIRPKDYSVRYAAERAAESTGVGLTWVWPSGDLDPQVDPIIQRPCEGNVAAMTDQLMEAQRMDQEPGSRSPRSLTEHEQWMREAEEIVGASSNGLMLKEVSQQLAPRFGRDSKDIRKALTKRINDGKGRSLRFEKRGGVNVVVCDKEIG